MKRTDCKNSELGNIYIYYFFTSMNYDALNVISALYQYTKDLPVNPSMLTDAIIQRPTVANGYVLFT